MDRLRIIHHTEYHYHSPVGFGQHTAMLRPREGHDLHIERATLATEPASTVRWVRDIYGNSIALLDFPKPSPVLKIHSEVDVDLYTSSGIECVLEPFAKTYPFQYAADEQVEIIPYRLPSYPHDGLAVQGWLKASGETLNGRPTLELLESLNTRVFESFEYSRREEAGVQVPCRTLALGSGSCRDFAVFLMEAARHLGFAARFVSGYILMGEGQHGATHAWTEIYLPGAGWIGFDPTNNKAASSEHVAVAVAREHEKACPLSGSWSGPSDAFDRMEVSVQVVSLNEGA